MLLIALNSIKVSAIMVPLVAFCSIIYQLTFMSKSIGKIIASLPPLIGWTAIFCIVFAVIWYLAMRYLARLA